MTVAATRRARRRLAALGASPPSRTRWPPAVERWVAAAGFPLPAGDLLTWWARAGGSLVLLSTLVGGVGGLVVAGLGSAAPAAVITLRQNHRRDQRRRSLPAVIDSLASSLRGGSSLNQAFVVAARTSPEAVRTDLGMVVERIERGASAANALDVWTTDDDPDVRLAGLTLVLLSSVGGHRAAALDRMSAVLRSRSDLRGRRDALAAQARFSAMVIAVAPVAFTAFSLVTDHRVAAFLLGTTPGLACVVSAVGLTVAGTAWMLRITGNAA